MWTKYFNNREPIVGDLDTSWSKTQLNNIIGVDLKIGNKVIPCNWGPGDYHYEEDWEVTVGKNDHTLLCIRLEFLDYSFHSKLIEVDPNGTILKYI